MKLILLSVCLVLALECQQIFSLSPARVALDILGANNGPFVGRFGGVRRKRQLDSVICITGCFGPMNEVTEGADVTSGQMNPDLFFDLEKLGQFCNASQEVQDCTDECPNSDLKKVLQVCFDIFDHVCVDNRQQFESYIPCYQESQEEKSRVCDARCGGAEEVKALQRRQAIAQLTGDVEELSQIMGETCELTSCVKSCESEVIGRVCQDEGTAKLLEKFGIAQFQQLKDAFEAKGISRYWPEQCPISLIPTWGMVRKHKTWKWFSEFVNYYTCTFLLAYILCYVAFLAQMSVVRLILLYKCMYTITLY